MKSTATLILITVLIFGCKKQNVLTQKKEDPLINKAKLFLKKKLIEEDFNNLNWDKIKTSVTPYNKNFLTIPVFEKKTETGSCLLLYMDSVSWKGNWASSNLIKNREDQTYSGQITAISLDKVTRREIYVQKNMPLKTITYHNGIEESTPTNTVRTSSYAVAIPAAVIVTGTQNWWNLSTYFLGGGSNSSYPNSNWYIEGIVPPTDEPDLGEMLTDSAPEIIEVETENSDASPGVDISKIFKCFELVPDAGATFELTLCSDVPINSHPDWPANVSFSPGHTFLIITKTNGTQSITQAIGFYPTTASLNAVPSKIVDNKEHEINASLKMGLTKTQFDLVKNNSLNYASLNYDISQMNCTNFALDIFNSVRPTASEIQIPPYTLQFWVPGSNITTVVVSKSPQELFNKLNSIKNTGGPESNNVVINQTHAYKAPLTHGECN